MDQRGEKFPPWQAHDLFAASSPNKKRKVMQQTLRFANAKF
jgi:hypothetical protein